MITIFYPDGSYHNYRVHNGKWQAQIYSCGNTPLFEDEDELLKIHSYTPEVFERNFWRD